ncbi:hypothetical protein F5050DRAFT_989224 [Lentinula boryana]|uniref:Uncharacterized protein n=1 Tax=Lentinula boryana TaxID=40481 RepID=A0ABQ8Q0G6_9AGAR|nr:hypothetical protein F5050DRAFT_989224 [Lentinula boryana]
MAHFCAARKWLRFHDATHLFLSDQTLNIHASSLDISASSHTYDSHVGFNLSTPNDPACQLYLSTIRFVYSTTGRSYSTATSSADSDPPEEWLRLRSICIQSYSFIKISIEHLNSLSWISFLFLCLPPPQSRSLVQSKSWAHTHKSKIAENIHIQRPLGCGVHESSTKLIVGKITRLRQTFSSLELLVDVFLPMSILGSRFKTSYLRSSQSVVLPSPFRLV